MASVPDVPSPVPTIVAAMREDLPAVRALLAAAGLPLDGLDEHLDSMLIARDADIVVGSATVEVYGRGGLLRSVVVAPERRGEQLGHRLTDAALDLARARGIERMYLLTETASAFFARRGFREIARAEVEPAVTRSREFQGACPATATAMVLDGVQGA